VVHNSFIGSTDQYNAVIDDIARQSAHTYDGPVPIKRLAKRTVLPACLAFGPSSRRQPNVSGLQAFLFYLGDNATDGKTGKYASGIFRQIIRRLAVIRKKHVDTCITTQIDVLLMNEWHIEKNVLLHQIFALHGFQSLKRLRRIRTYVKRARNQHRPIRFCALEIKQFRSDSMQFHFILSENFHALLIHY